MKFYFMPHSSSFATQTALEMVGLEYEGLKLDPMNKSAEFLKLNPAGQVPVLIDEDLVLTQNTAIIFYLDKKFPNAKLFGEDLKTQAISAKWLSFCNTDLHKAFVPLFVAPKSLNSEKEAFINEAKDKLISLFKVADDALKNQEFLAGSNFTIADAFLFIEILWAKGLKLEIGENLKNYFKKVSEIEVIKKTMEKQ